MDFHSAILELKREMSDRAKQNIKNAQLESVAMFIPKAKDKAMFLFREAILDFYADYSPISYERRYSLFDIIHIDTSVDTEKLLFNIEFDDANSPSNGVFDPIDMVFEKGWHGGAPSGPNHPNPGTPYWRKPVPSFTDWYKPAAVASESPNDSFIEKFKEFWEGGEAASILDSCWSVCAQKYFG